MACQASTNEASTSNTDLPSSSEEQRGASSCSPPEIIQINQTTDISPNFSGHSRSRDTTDGEAKTKAQLKHFADEEFEKEDLSRGDSDESDIDWEDVEGTFGSSDDERQTTLKKRRKLFTDLVPLSVSNDLTSDHPEYNLIHFPTDPFLPLEDSASDAAAYETQDDQLNLDNQPSNESNNAVCEPDSSDHVMCVIDAVAARSVGQDRENRREENGGGEGRSIVDLTPKRVRSEKDKFERDVKKYPFPDEPGCKSNKCTNSCLKFSSVEFRKIYDTCWSKEYKSRQMWLASLLTFLPVKRRTIAPEAACRKKTTVRYSLPRNSNDDPTLTPKVENLPVCKSTFLGCLGLGKNDRVIFTIKSKIERDALGNELKDGRGHKVAGPPNKVDRSLVMQHIESFQPAIPHYRRAHAPNVRYLSRDLSYKFMAEDFNEKYPANKICDETYRKILNGMKVLLCMPQSDSCDICTLLKEKVGAARTPGTNGEATEKETELYRKHIDLVEQVSKAFSEDKQKYEKDSTTMLFTVDLQKVLLLPIMHSRKEAFFLSRLVCFNETFAPVKATQQNQNLCVVWNESRQGRDAPDIGSAFHKVLKMNRDILHFIFYTDNCCAQNKNWTIFSEFVLIVNSEGGPETIRIKYLVKGHTHMGADSIHGSIESRIRKRDVLDFEDLCDTIEKSRKFTKAVKMDIEDFCQWKSLKAPGIVMKNLGVTIDEFSEVCFKKGKTELFYKTSPEGEEKSLSFVPKKLVSTSKEAKYRLPDPILGARGVKPEKKKAILEKLVPFMNENRRTFWRTMPSSTASVDLLKHGCVS